MDTDRDISSDFVGRVTNISLAPSPANALLPMFEAVTNAIQAIEDRFGADNLTSGQVTIEVTRDTADMRVIGFTVSDNGLGLTLDNMRSFETSDSRYKAKKGGKGIGRFLWLKVFERAAVASKFNGGELRFDFVLEDVKQIRNIALESGLTSIGTRVELRPFRKPYELVCPKKAETIRAKIISHFLPFFVNLNTPKILVSDGGSVDLFDEFSGLVKDDKENKFSVVHNGETLDFRVNCFLVPKAISDDEKGVNAIFYGANGRSVLRQPIDNAIGMQVIDGEFAFFGYVSGPYLDKHANQERTGFSWPEDLRDQVHRMALGIAKDFLGGQIKKVRAKQAEVVAKLLNENLRFMTIVDNPTEFAAKLDLATQSPEEVFLELSREARREESRTRAAYAEAKKKKSDIDDDVKKYTERLSKESVASLAEYVYKRKLILNAFEDKLNYTDLDKKRYELEEIAHDLICPLQTTKSELNYEDHNLWIVDDQLAFYSYFNSDKTLRATTGGADKSTKEPDITFFDLGIGFDRNGTMDPVSIIEFKRPGRDDYTLADNPIIQIRDYCSRLREAKRIVSYKGGELRPIDDATPFMGHIIADVTPSLQKMLKQFGPYAQRASSTCYFKWDEEFRMFIQIQSYADVLRGAKARNEAFFQKLGLSN